MHPNYRFARCPRAEDIDHKTHKIVMPATKRWKNLKLYGPKNVFDYVNATTCWNSEGSSSGKKECYFTVDFGRMVIPTELRIQFQAGFSAEQIVVFKSSTDGQGYEQIEELETEDEHGIQAFPLPCGTDEESSTSSIKLVFDEFTDFYGRITIYQLQIWGKEVPAEKNLVD
eukprot:scaffold1736_cov127-Cylindrotheca_fusiformis.AAC.86